MGARTAACGQESRADEDKGDAEDFHPEEEIREANIAHGL
jgi:hypothetical protein